MSSEEIQLPEWIRSKKTHLHEERELKRLFRHCGVRTICEEARCPNRSECFKSGTATFLILGRHCTRNCRFCNVSHGEPLPLNDNDVDGMVEALRVMGLRYAVLTTVTRDDLADRGASFIARLIRLLKDEIDNLRVEILSPDLDGDPELIGRVLNARPDVYAHNIETVERLTPGIRSGADYERSLKVLDRARRFSTGTFIKSGLLVGMGEEENEIIKTISDIRSTGCEILTIGQYLQPSRASIPVSRYWPPEAFRRWEAIGLEAGFRKVFSGPFVRSSYRAHTVFD